MDATKDLKATLQQDFDRLVALRDELRVQLKLATNEASEEWQRLESKWLGVQDELSRIGSQSKEPAHQLGAAAKQLLGELKLGYERIRSQLK